MDDLVFHREEKNALCLIADQSGFRYDLMLW